MVKQIRDYVLEARQIRESKTIDDIDAMGRAMGLNIDNMGTREN